MRALDPKLHGKPRLKWDGPCRITTVLGFRAYRVAILNGRALNHFWNIS